MTRISMKTLLGVGAVAAIAAMSLAPVAYAQQEQQGSMTSAPPPGYYMGPNGQPGMMPPTPQQNAYMQSPQEMNQPTQLHQMDPRYPGPAIH
jgi:hypothetical protein